MIIECSPCGVMVDAQIIGEHKFFSNDDSTEYKALLLVCPICKEPLYGMQSFDHVAPDNYEWSEPNRLWPEPQYPLDWRIPAIVRTSLEEAHKCFKANAYSACAVMAGRALEGICRQFQTRSKTLSSGLEELRDKGIIDGRLFQWSHELRILRNIGAHATDENISEEDADDLLEFANAICDYVFVLNHKFENFMKRHKKKP